MNPSGVSAWSAAWLAIKDYIPLFAVIVAVIIPLSASFFGAWTAQWIADRNRFRDEIGKEIRNTNAAISLAFAVCNTGIALKRQHVTRIKREFEQAKADFVDHFRRREIGQIQGNAQYRFTLPLMTLTPPAFAVDAMRGMVLERLSAVGRPLSLAVEVGESCARLIACLEARNEQVSYVKSGDMLNLADGAPRFFGLVYGGGHRDATVPETLEAIVSSLDDVIFFSHLLCVDLQKYGARQVEKYRKRLGSANVPRITSIDFGERIADGSIPPEAQYVDWMVGFAEHTPEPTRWQRLTARGSRRAVRK